MALKKWTPVDVVMEAELIFCCVSNSKVTCHMLLQQCRVLNMLRPRKMYVELTTLHADTARDIAQAVRFKGSLFLEAQMVGDAIQAAEGNLTLLTSGDKNIILLHPATFNVMSQNIKYFGDTGVASN